MPADVAGGISNGAGGAGATGGAYVTGGGGGAIAEGGSGGSCGSCGAGGKGGSGGNAGALHESGAGLAAGAGGGVGTPLASAGVCVGVRVGVAAEEVVDDGPVARAAAPAMSLATERPAAATPFSTPIALFMRPIASEIRTADTPPARSVSSTASANRVNALAGALRRSAYLDSRNST
jgi:hypothetical protein